MTAKKEIQKIKTHETVIIQAGNNPACIHYETIINTDQLLLGTCQRCQQIREYRPLPVSALPKTFRVRNVYDDEAEDFYGNY